MNFLALGHQSNLNFNYGSVGETSDNLKMWAINEIVQVFDNEMQQAFADVEALPCELN